MSGRRSGALLRDIQTLFDAGTASGLSDRQLLERFTSRRDDSAEAAFEVLMLRHGPMVLRVCHNVLGDSTDAQDAFQATFLVLVKRSGSIRRLESVGSWLYGVACRVAARARVEAARRRAAERQGALRVVQAKVNPSCGDDPDRAEFGMIVQEEVQRLPEKYRAVVVLCYWQGLTQEQAAAQLGCPLGTVRSRLARARRKLHARLTRRGVAPIAMAAAGALGPGIAQTARLAPPPSVLVHSTVKASAQMAAGCAMSNVASTTVAILVHGILRSMFMMKLKTIAAAIVFVGIGAYGAGLAAPQAERLKTSPDSQRRPNPTVAKSKSAVKSKPKAQPAFVAREDYVIEPPDVLLVEVLQALPGRPITGERLVRPDGKISLGFYGDVYVAGLTLPEAKEQVIQHLRKHLADDILGILDADPGTDKARIDPETGKPNLLPFRDSDEVFVDIAKSNSKNYYVQGDVVIPGRMPITGKDTVLDAINTAGGLGPLADHKGVVLYRPGRNGGPRRALHVDIDQITMGDDLSTNYQLQAGDRLVVPHDQNAASKAAQAGAEPPAIEPAGRADDRSALLRVEQRLTDVERKLDQVLEALKARTP